MSAVWRLILHDRLDGDWNMAVDRAIQHAREDGSVPATLRLYAWNRPTVTLGRFQDPTSIQWDACRGAGIDVVRRFTGGRGVLHDDEVTYSLVASRKDGVPSGTAASYRYLCEGLVRAYELMGVPAGMTARPRGEADSAACYLHATRADLSVGSSKLAGSAQTWVGDTCLQHGSFTIHRDVDLEARVFMLSSRQRDTLRQTSKTLKDLLPLPPDPEAVCDAVVQGISESLGVRLEAGQLTDREHELASSLMPDVRVVAPKAR